MQGIELCRLHSAKKAHTYNLEYHEQQLIRDALSDLTAKGYSHEEIARELGIGIATLYRKMKRL